MAVGFLATFGPLQSKSLLWVSATVCKEEKGEDCKHYGYGWEECHVIIVLSNFILIGAESQLSNQELLLCSSNGSVSDAHKQGQLIPPEQLWNKV